MFGLPHEEDREGMAAFGWFLGHVLEEVSGVPWVLRSAHDKSH